MLIKLKNSTLMAASEHLYSLKLQGKATRGRQKLNRKLSEKLQDLSQDAYQLKEEYESEELEAQAKLLEQEIVVLDMTEYEDHMYALYDATLNYGHELEEADAVRHDFIVDILEEAIDEKKKKDETQIQEVE